MDETTVDQIINDAGTVRVRIVHDQYADEPYDSGGSPILYREHGAIGFEQVTGVTSYRISRRIEDAADRFTDNPNLFERYLRMFHGTTQIRWHETRDATYVTLDTKHWRQTVGLTDEYMTKTTDVDWIKSLANMDEYVAWLEGDTYALVAERLDRWTNHRTGEHEDRWTVVDSCAGYYGMTDYLQEQARDMLAAAQAD